GVERGLVGHEAVDLAEERVALLVRLVARVALGLEVARALLGVVRGALELGGRRRELGRRRRELAAEVLDVRVLGLELGEPPLERLDALGEDAALGGEARRPLLEL